MTVRYGRILGDAWKSLWRAWAMWGVVGTSFGLMAVLIVGVSLGFFAVFGTALSTGAPGDPELALVVILMAVFAVLGLVMIPVSLLLRGASIHLANEVLEGRPARYMDGIRAGGRRLGSLALFEIVLYAILVGVSGVLLTLWLLLIFGVFSTGDQASGAIGAVIGGVCFIYLIAIVAEIAAVLVLQPFEAVGARAAVLSGRTGIGAFKDAWSALRHSFKSMIVMSLIALGIMWGYSFITGIVLTPLQLLLMPQAFFDPAAMESVSDPAALLSSMGTFYAVYGAASIVLTFPLTVFSDLVWTGFYRQLVGIAPAEEPVAPPVYAHATPVPPETAAPASPVAAGPDVIPPPPGSPLPAPPTAQPPMPAAPQEPPITQPPTSGETDPTTQA